MTDVDLDRVVRTKVRQSDLLVSLARHLGDKTLGGSRVWRWDTNLTKSGQIEKAYKI